MPYPDDISIGPLNDSSPALTHPATNSSSELSQILLLLHEQKKESEKTNNELRQTNQQVALLQQRMNSIVSSESSQLVSTTALTTTTPSLSTTTTWASSTLTTQAVNTPPSIPHSVANAAANLAVHLQSGMAGAGPQFTGLTIDQLRSNPALAAQAADVLSAATREVPPLNQFAAINGPAAHHQAWGSQQVTSVDQLFRATTVNKQLRAYEFASTGQFQYKNVLKQDNCNAITFAYGAIKHLHAVKSGLIHMTDNEFLARLKHIKNVFEIACMSSPLSSFSDPSWQVAREYDSRVIADIESGIKSWETLANGIEPDSIYMAKETVELRNKANAKKNKSVDPSKKTKDDNVKRGDPKKNGCTTYNTHRSSEGCFWESQHRGETCVYKHFCSWCKLNREVEEKHKVFNCEYKPADE